MTIEHSLILQSYQIVACKSYLKRLSTCNSETAKSTNMLFPSNLHLPFNLLIFAPTLVASYMLDSSCTIRESQYFLSLFFVSSHLFWVYNLLSKRTTFTIMSISSAEQSNSQSQILQHQESRSRFLSRNRVLIRTLNDAWI